jgi:hypothetical protein
LRWDVLLPRSGFVQQAAARGLDTVVAVFAKRKGSKNSPNLLAGEQGVIFFLYP